MPPPDFQARVSGPGAASRRTDLFQPKRVPTGLDYGEGKKVEGMQDSVPIRRAPGAGAGGGGAQTDPLATIAAAPSQRPDRPITAGLNAPKPTRNVSATLAGLEVIMGRLESISPELMDLYLRLKEQSL